MLDRSMMPTKKRGSIGEIKPTGWVQEMCLYIIFNPGFCWIIRRVKARGRHPKSVLSLR